MALYNIFNELHRADISHKKIHEQYTEVDESSEATHSTEKLSNGLTSKIWEQMACGLLRLPWFYAGDFNA